LRFRRKVVLTVTNENMVCLISSKKDSLNLSICTSTSDGSDSENSQPSSCKSKEEDVVVNSVNFSDDVAARIMKEHNRICKSAIKEIVCASNSVTLETSTVTDVSCGNMGESSNDTADFGNDDEFEDEVLKFLEESI